MIEKLARIPRGKGSFCFSVEGLQFKPGKVDENLSGFDGWLTEIISSDPEEPWTFEQIADKIRGAIGTPESPEQQRILERVIYGELPTALFKLYRSKKIRASIRKTPHVKKAV